MKTFNVGKEVQVEMFMGYFLDAKKGYLEKLERIRRGRFIKVKSFAGRYGL